MLWAQLRSEGVSWGVAEASSQPQALNTSTVCSDW